MKNSETYLINISIDDVSPFSISSTKVLNNCYDLIKIYPNIKFSLFIPMAYWRTIIRGTDKYCTITDKPMYLSEYPEFTKKLKELPKENFELCYHGFYHGIPYIDNNNEFKFLNYDEAICKFNKMFQEAKKSEIFNKIKPIFRPPGWGMSSESIIAAKDSGIKVLALSPDPAHRDSYLKKDEEFSKVSYFSSSPPWYPLNRLTTRTSIVYHACEWSPNYLSKSEVNKIINIIKNSNNIKKFVFTEEISDFGSNYKEFLNYMVELRINTSKNIYNEKLKKWKDYRDMNASKELINISKEYIEDINLGKK